MTWAEMAKYAPIATASVAALALIVGVTTLVVQRNLARRRASVDFFIKTEMDREMLKAWDAYNAGIKKFQELGIPVHMFAAEHTVEYDAVRAYLNIHELIAAGIANEIFDEDICYDFWGNILLRACVDAQQIINFAKSKAGHEHTYHSLIALNRSWKLRNRNAVAMPPPDV